MSTATKVQDKRHARNAELQYEYLELRDELSEAANAGDRRRERQLSRRIEDNQAEFVRLNMGLAGTVSRKFTADGGPNVEDYNQDAVVGLLEARKKWDPAKGTFATFSRAYITGRVQQGVRQAEFRLSKGDFAARPNILGTANLLEERLGRPPTDDEVAKGAGVTVDVVRRIRCARATSLDLVVGDGEATLGDFQVDTPLVDSEEVDGAQQASQFLESVVGVLDAVELFVLVRYHGLDGAWPQTLAELGEFTGRGREPIRRILNGAESKARELGLNVGRLSV